MKTVGIDEVGRGCWAGPVVAAAVILDAPIEGLADSKKLSKKRRENLAVTIQDQALAIGVGWVSAAEVDEFGLTVAVGLAMERALNQITIPFDHVIVDGSFNYFPDEPRVETIIKADESIPEVSAASIIAKVARDNFMTNIMHAKFPEYAFDKHVGYGTSLHQQMLKLYGVSEIHRKSFRPIRLFLEGGV